MRTKKYLIQKLNQQIDAVIEEKRILESEKYIIPGDRLSELNIELTKLTKERLNLKAL
tara:strand:- start:1377 stop:1550 length:174 start_codon:yes stop_codon:yes gene_type:complete